MAGAIVSKMAKAVRELSGDSFNPQSLMNKLKNFGVKDTELKASGMADSLQRASNENRDVSAVEVGNRVEARRDELRVLEKTENPESGLNTHRSNFLDVTLPGTNAETYTERVYRHPVLNAHNIGETGNTHFGTVPDYSFHTRVDKVPEVALSTKISPISDFIRTPDNPRALRDSSSLDTWKAAIKDTAWSPQYRNAPGLVKLTPETVEGVKNFEELIDEFIRQADPELTVDDFLTEMSERFQRDLDQAGIEPGDPDWPFTPGNALVYSHPGEGTEITTSLSEWLEEIPTLEHYDIEEFNTLVANVGETYEKYTRQSAASGINNVWRVQEIQSDIARRAPERRAREQKLDQMFIGESNDPINSYKGLVETVQRLNQKIGQYDEDWMEMMGVGSGLPDTMEGAIAFKKFMMEFSNFKNLNPEDQRPIIDILDNPNNLDAVLDDTGDMEFPKSLKWGFASRQKGMGDELNYVKDGINQEIVAASQQGFNKVAIAIKPHGVEKLSRSTGVQSQHYDKTVLSSAKKIAKQIGATVEEKNGYIVLGLPAAFSVSTYAAENEIDLNALDKNKTFIGNAVSRGFSEDEAKDMLFVQRAMHEGGLSEDEARRALDEQRAANVDATDTYATGSAPVVTGETAAPLNQGLPTEIPEESFAEAMKYLLLSSPGDVIDDNSGGKKVSDVVADLEATIRVIDPILDIGSFFSPEIGAKLQEYETQLAGQVVDMAKERGINLQFDPNEGQYSVTDAQGNTAPVTPGLLQTMGNAKYEFGGAVVGGVIGAAKGPAMMGALTGARSTPGGLIPKVVGSFVGAALGSMGGTELDYLSAAISTHETLSARIAFEKAIGAGKASVTYDALLGSIGYPLAKLGGLGYRGLRHAWNHIANGNRQGAFDALKSQLDLREGEIDQILDLYESINGQVAPGANRQEQALAVAPVTRPGGESILREVSGRNPEASMAISREVNQRAKTLLDASEEIVNDDGAREVLGGMRKLVDDTNLYYSTVKDEFVSIETRVPPEAIDISDREFADLTDSILNNIQDFRSHEFVTDQMRRVEQLYNTASTPQELLDLRRQFTQLEYNREITQTPTLEKISALVKKVDSAIERTAKEAMGEEAGEEWIENWQQATKDYSNMLRMQRNGLYNALTKPTTKGKAITPKSVANALVRYGQSIDDAYIRNGGKPVNTYDEIIDELDLASIKQVEGIIVNDLVERYTAGTTGTFRATQFPELAEVLKLYNFRTTGAQRISEVVDQLAQLYRNDVMISRNTGGITTDQFQSFLTTNPVVRAQYAIASEVFNYSSQLLGSKKSNTRAMVNWVAKLLDEPLNTRTTAHLLEEVEQDQRIAGAIKDYQAEYAKAQQSGTEPHFRVQTYRNSDGSRFVVRGDEGIPANAVKDAGVPYTGITEESFVKQLLGEDVDLDNLSRLDRAELLGLGYEAVALPNGRLISLIK